jgi:tRNA pseudouridine13 synthase
MKIKSQPEDFIVEEILNAEPKDRGAYHLYRVQKRSLNTTDLVPRLALGVPTEAVAYGGRKDKHALASQHLSVRSNRPLPKRAEKQNFKLAFIGFLDRPMGPDLIKENRFTLTVRDLTAKEIDIAIAEFDAAKAFGYPNYFDDQRFGSYDNRQGFLAEKILKKHDNGAVKIYLTRFGSQDNKQEKTRKEKIFASWGDWSACLKMAATDLEKFAFKHLKNSPKDFRFLLRRIPRDELSGYFGAYQAYLWNEILRRFLPQRVPVLRTAAGRLGPYLFYGKPSGAEQKLLSNLNIPLPAGRIPPEPEDIRRITEQLFAEHGLKNSLFNLKTIRHAFFKPVPRPAIAIPGECRHEALEDEKNRDREKIILNFTLPRGSYATMLVKRIFSLPLPE